MRKTRLVLLEITLLILVIVSSVAAIAEEPAEKTHKGVFVDDGRVQLVPEAERFMEFAVLGLWPNQKDSPFFPELKYPASATPGQKRFIEEQCYWMNFELTHGDIIEHLPAYSHFYVALPDRSIVKESRGREKEYFMDYLKARCNFSDAEIKKRFEFFTSPVKLEWPQDICKVIGFDNNGRKILAYSNGDIDSYVATTKKIAQVYPDKFVAMDLGTCTSAEGGDENIIWTPDNKVALILGKNRIIRYLNRNRGMYFEHSSLSDDMVEEAREAYSKALYNTKVIILPEKILYDHDRGSEEIFHLDMISAVLPPANGGKPVAFVPSVARECYDSLTREKFSDDYIKHEQAEYDAAASQFKELGYEVARLPFADHPVRCPVNIVRYRDMKTGVMTVLLAKFPYQLPINDPNTPQRQILDAFDLMVTSYDNWYNAPGKETYLALTNALANCWVAMEKATSTPNPIFDEQVKVFKKYGYKVEVVPTYAWGAGGLHCQLLY